MRGVTMCGVSSYYSCSIGSYMQYWCYNYVNNIMRIEKDAYIDGVTL